MRLQSPMPASLLLCLIVGISDGDTLTARCGEADSAQTLTVRLAEIDAPERRQPFGEHSKWHLSGLCYRQRAEVRPTGKDRYGRTVARVACSGIDANAAMVRAGMAWAFTKYQTDSSGDLTGWRESALPVALDIIEPEASTG